ncbi:MAG TPA: DMT family transporter [Candidatus Bathyarchaeia archaeon]|nr:DMT family transporter [Candidatus Bathyarchaeia archaeon]
MDKRSKAYLALLTTCIIWGFAPPIIKYSLGFVTPIEFLTLRFLIVSVLILPVFLSKYKKQPFKLKDLGLLILIALCGTTFTLGLLFWGLSKTSAIDSAVIAATCPLMIVISGVVFLKEIVTKQEKVGLGLAFLGTLIAVASPLVNGNKMFHSANISGNFLIFVSNITWTVYSILSKKLTKKYSSFNITAFSFFVGFLTFSPLFYLTSNLTLTTLFSNPGFPGILYMSILGSIIGYFTYTYGFSLIEASEATLFSYLQPIFSVPLAVLWLKEKVTLPFLLGSLFIALGVFLTERKGKRII